MPRIDRVLVDLTIKVTASICSSQLARCISAVVEKLEGVESRFARLTRTMGRSLAQQISAIAQKIENVSAKTGQLADHCSLHGCIA